MTSGEMSDVMPQTNGNGKGRETSDQEQPHNNDHVQRQNGDGGGGGQEKTGEKVVKKSLNDSGRETAPNTPDSERPQSAENEEKKEVAVTPGVSLATDKIYKLTINPVNAESFDLQVNTAEMIQELHQVLLEREATCHRTCFSLQLNGQTLDCFTDIRNIPEIVDGSVLLVVEEPYTLRQARIHIRHVRDLLRSGNEHIADAANAVDSMSLSYLPSINLTESTRQTAKDRTASDGQPPDYVLPGTKDRSLTHLLPAQPKLPSILRNLAVSPFNPPPGPRKMRGDIMYIVVDTLEKRRFHITCSSKGWFVNLSSDESFDPTPSTQYRGTHHALIDLLQTISPGFKKGYAALLNRRSTRPMLDRLPTAYPVYSWLTPGQTEIREDYIRAEDGTQMHRVGFEDHLPGQIRDWNEELQVTHDMVRSSLPERVVRDRSVYKIHGDFINAAIRGAIAVTDQNVMAINPADEPKAHMYIWNNLFYSLGFDVKDHYKEFGGDAAAFVATSIDLQGVKAYAALEESKLCTLGMAVIDYRGYRVTAQSIIPGILDREQEQSVIYGSTDFGKTIVSDEKYHKVLAEAAKELRILPHEVLTKGDNESEDKQLTLYSSYETKGIIGNEGRQYVLDLLRTFPPDVHFIEDAQVSEAAKKLGFPRKHPHKLAALRQELVEQFYENRYLQFIRTAATYAKEKAQSLSVEEQNALENEMARVFVELSEGHDIETDNLLIKEGLVKAAEAVHSLRPNTLDIRFNADCYSKTLRNAPTEDLEAHRKLVVEAAEFILTNQLPELVAACVDGTMNIVDGELLAEHMHYRGINIRYLGEVMKRVVGLPHGYLRSLVGGELVARCVKHVFRQYLVTVPQDQLAAALLHLLNCLFGSVDQPASMGSTETKGGGKRSNKKATGLGGKKLTAEWATVTTKGLWKSICEESLNYYGYELKADTMDALTEAFGMQRVSLLRRICRCMGIQLLAKDYHLDFARQSIKTPFSEEDIQNVFPVFKHRNPAASDAKKLYTRGQQAMQMGHLKDAYEFVAESINLMTSVYGAIHSELAQAMRLLAKLSYILGDLPEALSQQHKATLMSERCNGLDHGHTIVEYVNLAHFTFGNLRIPPALNLLYRARYLLLVTHGEKHPLMAQIDANIGIILFAVQEFDYALKFLYSAESLLAMNGEPKKLKSAMVQHIIARSQAARGDFRSALAAEKETAAIYEHLFGADHPKTLESFEYLKQLTQQAVNFQKKMMDATSGATKGATLAQFLPLTPQPSLGAILDALNLINGIIIISMAPASASAQPSTSQDTTTATEGQGNESESTVPLALGERMDMQHNDAAVPLD